MLYFDDSSVPERTEKVANKDTTGISHWQPEVKGYLLIPVRSLCLSFPLLAARQRHPTGSSLGCMIKIKHSFADCLLVILKLVLTEHVTYIYS